MYILIGICSKYFSFQFSLHRFSHTKIIIGLLLLDIITGSDNCLLWFIFGIPIRQLSLHWICCNLRIQSFCFHLTLVFSTNNTCFHFELNFVLLITHSNHRNIYTIFRISPLGSRFLSLVLFLTTCVLSLIFVRPSSYSSPYYIHFILRIFSLRSMFLYRFRVILSVYTFFWYLIYHFFNHYFLISIPDYEYHYDIQQVWLILLQHRTQLISLCTIQYLISIRPGIFMYYSQPCFAIIHIFITLITGRKVYVNTC